MNHFKLEHDTTPLLSISNSSEEQGLHRSRTRQKQVEHWPARRWKQMCFT